MDFTTHRHAPLNCPTCKKKLDAATAIEGDACPGDGDWTICLGCGARLRYALDGEILSLNTTTIQEFFGLPSDVREQLNRARLAVIMTQNRRRTGMN